MKNRITASISIIIALLALAAGVGVFSSKYYQTDTASKPAIQGLFWPNPKHIRSFETVDQKGNFFGLEQLQGKWSFLFFGYTHCPDICPVTLSVLNNVYNQLVTKGQADNLQIIFVSVDPNRDTPEQLNNYIRYYNKDFIGLGGTEQQISSLTQQIGIVYIHGEETSPGEYNVDHSASVFLVDPRGRLVSLFSAPHQTDEIADRFRTIRDFIDKQS